MRTILHGSQGPSGQFLKLLMGLEKGTNNKIIHTKLLISLLWKISAKSSTNRIKKARDGCFKHYTYR